MHVNYVFWNVLTIHKDSIILLSHNNGQKTEYNLCHKKAHLAFKSWPGNANLKISWDEYKTLSTTEKAYRINRNNLSNKKQTFIE